MHLTTDITVVITMVIATIAANIQTTIITRILLSIPTTTTIITRMYTIATTTRGTKITDHLMKIAIIAYTAIITPITTKETYSQILKRKLLRKAPKQPFSTLLASLLSTPSI